MTATLIPVLATAVSAAPSTKCADSAPSTKTAAAMAVACKRDVAIDSSRSEYVQIVARPNGKLVFESAIAPQRTKRSDGTWANIDLGLMRGQDSLLRPVASVADVAFSGGGNGPLVTVKRNGKSMTMSWPAALPAPTVSGDSATYANVLKDVDLVVRATRTGFTHVLVVKNAAAAASVSQVRFDMGGDVTVKRQASGALRAVAGDVVVASARPAVMWDSTTSAAADTLSSSGARTATGASVVDTAPSSARAAGDIARVKSVGTEVTAAGDLVLRPDVSLLGASSAYPVYVDPDWEYGSGSGQKWAYATDNNETNETSVARVGKQVASSGIYRSFFEFPTSSGSVSLKGKYIHSAYVGMLLTHSSSCTDQYTYMYATPAINAVPKASWSTMSLGTLLASQKGHANEAGGCGAIQPDMAMNFTGSTVLNHVRTAANNSWNSISVGFSARDGSGGGEGTIDRWMKYVPENAKLVVEYDSKPGAPVDLQVHGVACLASGVLAVGTTTPQLSAIYPDADVTQTLAGTYEWVEVPTGGIGAVTDTSPVRLTPPAAASATANGRATTNAVSGVVVGKTYAFRAKATDPAPYSLVSPWSSWCQFKADLSVPQVSVTVVTNPAGPGLPGTFEISSTDTDVTKFRYGWGTATTEVVATGTSPRTATITVAAPKFGKNILSVAAVDGAGNVGYGSVEFTVGRPSPAIAHWLLQTVPGVDTTQAFADQQPNLPSCCGIRGSADTDLVGSSAWTGDVRLVGGQTATFDGTQRLTAWAIGPEINSRMSVVDSSRSHTIAAWVRLTDSSVDREIVTKVGISPAVLYEKSSNKWVAKIPTNSSTWAKAYSTSTPQLNTWTHIAVVYDADAKTMSLYVNGIRETASVNVAGVYDESADYMMVGGNGAPWKGQIADVRVFNRVVVDHDFTGQLASDTGSGGFNEPGLLDPAEVADWDFSNSASCFVADLKDSCEAQDSSGWDRWQRLTLGASINTGYSEIGLGAWFDGVLDPESATPTATIEYGRSSAKTGTTGPDANGNEFTTWQDAPVLRTDQSFTISAWANLSSATSVHTVVSHAPGTYGKVPFALVYTGGDWAFTMSTADVATPNWQAVRSKQPAEIGKWVHLTAVYDASRKVSTLYVNGEIQNTYTNIVAWHKSGSTSIGAYGNTANRWSGGIDEVRIFQGAMNETAVKTAYEQQAPTS